MGLRSLHCSACVYSTIGFNSAGCASNDTAAIGPHEPSWEPDYLQALIELRPERLARFIERSQYEAYSDQPWPLLYHWASHRWPALKFVLWERNSTEWTYSMLNYFRPPAAPRRMMLFGYGFCQVTMDHFDGIRRAYESHLTSIKRFFSAPERSSRLLLVDFASPGAAAQICSFVRGASHTACTNMSASVPRAHAMRGRGRAYRMG